MTTDGAPTYHYTTNQPRDKTFSEERTTAEIRVASRKRGSAGVGPGFGEQALGRGTSITRSFKAAKFVKITLDSSIGES